MNRPANPHKYHIAIKANKVHHIEGIENDDVTICGELSDSDWLLMFITQEQLDAMPSERWCRACLREVSS